MILFCGHDSPLNQHLPFKFSLSQSGAGSRYLSIGIPSLCLAQPDFSYFSWLNCVAHDPSVLRARAGWLSLIAASQVDGVWPHSAIGSAEMTCPKTRRRATATGQVLYSTFCGARACRRRRNQCDAACSGSRHISAKAADGLPAQSIKTNALHNSRRHGHGRHGPRGVR